MPPTTLNTGTDPWLGGSADAVATITLNRPYRRNALSDELTLALRHMLLTAEPIRRCAASS